VNEIFQTFQIVQLSSPFAVPSRSWTSGTVFLSFFSHKKVEKAHGTFRKVHEMFMQKARKGEQLVTLNDQ
jgi:hypothetical protein